MNSLEYSCNGINYHLTIAANSAGTLECTDQSDPTKHMWLTYAQLEYLYLKYQGFSWKNAAEVLDISFSAAKDRSAKIRLNNGLPEYNRNDGGGWTWETLLTFAAQAELMSPAAIIGIGIALEQLRSCNDGKSMEEIRTAFSSPFMDFNPDHSQRDHHISK